MVARIYYAGLLCLYIMDANRGSSNKERFPTTLERNLWHSKTTGCDKREKVQTDPQTFSSLKKIVNSGCKKIR